ncbi:type I pullulanase [Vallitalea okinawensis]|uniref:type I pullulanase n=1 Tax=Vallitalea okinawensis TaxID=2078660 RepID=UPI000CFBA925|nr:type I pullulanase [Vallitalea okinawensis]
MKKVLSICLAFILLISAFSVPITINVNAAESTLIVHYQRDDRDYDDWNLWIWPTGGEGEVFEFQYEDDFGKVAVVNHQMTAEQFGFIVRTDDWDKDVSEDRFVDIKNEVAEIWIYSGKEDVLYEAPEGYSFFYASSATVSADESPEVNTEDSTNLRVHYRRYDNNYEGWNLWLWPEGGEGSAYQFNDEDEFGKIAEVEVPNTKGVSGIGVIVRMNEWEAKDIDEDRYMEISKVGDDGILDLYILQGDSTLYYDQEDIDLSPRFLGASLTQLDKVDIEVSVPFKLVDSKESFSIVSDDGKNIPIKHVTCSVPEEFVTTATVITEEPLELGKNYKIAKGGYEEMSISFASLYSSEEFEEAFFYGENDLGAFYSKESTTFRLWAPTASSARVLLYKDGDQGEVYRGIDMTKDINGTWVAKGDGDLSGTFYTYEVEVQDKINEGVDPYAKAVGVNGKRGMVIDLSLTDPDGWEQDTKPVMNNFTDAIIYELHIRDLSMDEDSGIENKGKFLGLKEAGTTNAEGLSTGLDHIKDLGVTHVHLLPSFDYRSIDEAKLDDNNFNWGYDPENYNVPEGSYSTDPYSGTTRIKEYKEMVKTLHENDLRVVMDVVYNHTGATADSNLNKLVPDYYYRLVNGKFSNGSGCGNETASDRAMVRKMIVDSVVYWATEYHVDGFRFDLMGLHDIETMNAIREALDKVDPTIIIYGEGWTGGATPLLEGESALKKNINQVHGVAAFNDDMRDGIKGHVFSKDEPGFANGLDGMEESVKFGIVAATQHDQIRYSNVNYSNSPWALEPSQSINYVSAHDNLTLWDKLAETNPNDSEEERIKMDKLSNAIVLTSQGIPFIHAGSEMLRTKDGDENSYKSPDAINQLDWSRKTEYMDVYNYYKGLIEFRKAHPALRMTSTEDINNNLVFFGMGEDYADLRLPDKNMVGYLITNHANGDKAGTILTLFNANPESKEVTIPDGGWHVYINGESAGTEVLETISGNKATVEGRSALVLTAEEVLYTIDKSQEKIEVSVEADSKIEQPEVEDTNISSKVGRILTVILLIVVVGLGIFTGYKRFKK